MMSKLRIGLSVAVLLTTASTAGAERYDVTVGSTTRMMHSGSVSALTGDRSQGFFSMQGAFRLDRGIVPGLGLHLDVSGHTGGFDGTTFGRLRSQTDVSGLAAGARVTRELSPLVGAFGRATLGLSHVTLTLRDDASGADPLRDRGWTGTAYLGGGIDFMPLRRLTPEGDEVFAIGLRTEVGYEGVTPIEMRARPESRSGDPDTLRIPMEEVSVGHLNLSAWIVRVGLAGQF